jgi:hypothetical protein
MVFPLVVAAQPAGKGPKIGTNPPIAKPGGFRLTGDLIFERVWFSRAHQINHQTNLRPALWAGFAFSGASFSRIVADVIRRESPYHRTACLNLRVASRDFVIST